VERTDSTALATFFMTEAAIEPHAQVALGESVARHLRARRLGAGTTVALVDGAGRRGVGMIVREAKDSVTVEVGDVEEIAPFPEVHLMVPVADRDRMLWLAEKATELAILPGMDPPKEPPKLFRLKGGNRRSGGSKAVLRSK